MNLWRRSTLRNDAPTPRGSLLLGAVDNRVIARVQGTGSPVLTLNSGVLGFAADVDASGGGRRIVRAASRPEMPLEYAEVGAVESEGTVERRASRDSRARPRTECASGGDGSRGTALSRVARNGIAVPVENARHPQVVMSQTFGAFPVSFGIIVNLQPSRTADRRCIARSASTGAPVPFPAGLPS
jgi:hypothetical protein